VISINGVNVTIGSFTANLTTNVLLINLNQVSNVPSKAIWLIPVNITMPIVAGNYPSILLNVSNNAGVLL
jgi:hypothetical protein